MPRPRCWTDEQFIAAVAASRTLSEVHRRLGLRAGKYDVMRSHIKRLGLDASHLPRASEGSPQTGRKFTDEDLVEAVQIESTLYGVLRRLGYNTNGGMFRYVVSHIKRLGLDTSHFRGQGWSRGLRRPSTRVKPLEEILVEGSTAKSGHVRQRLLRAGLKQPRCEMCGLAEWRGDPISLELDHINGDHTDNRLENLRILCSNCHATTENVVREEQKPA